MIVDGFMAPVLSEIKARALLTARQVGLEREMLGEPN